MKFNISNSLKKVLKVSTGTLGGQLINVVSLPIFTRIYGVEIIGLWVLLNSIYMVINSFSDLGLTQAIIFSDKRNETSQKVYSIITSFSLLISFVSSFAIFVVLNLFSLNFNFNSLFIFLYSFFSIFVLQQIKISYTWINKCDNYSLLMKNPIINNLLFAILGIALGLIGMQKYGYFIAFLSAQIITLVLMRKHVPKFQLEYNFKYIHEFILEYREFIKYQLPSNILNQVKNQISTFLISIFFGAEILGFYSISVRLLNIPINLIGRANGRVFFQEASEMASLGKSINQMTKNSVELMMKIAIVPIIILIGLGEMLTVFFFGSEFIVAGRMLVITSVQSYFILMATSLRGLEIIINKQKFIVIRYVWQILGIFMVFVITFRLENFYITLILMSFVIIFTIIFFFFKVFKEMGISNHDFLKKLFFYFLIILISGFLLRFLVGLYF